MIDSAYRARGSTLHRGQVHDLLTELNEGIKVCHTVAPLN